MSRKLAVGFTVLAASMLWTVPAAASASAALPPGQSSTVMNGAKEVPGPGDPDGVGRAQVLGDPAHSRVCTSIGYRDIGTAMMAHIHQGPPTVAGPIVVNFSALIATSPPGTIRGCVATTVDLAMQIADSPEGFYVNVHTADFTAGAIRGQLHR